MKQILKHILILAFAAGFIGTACENNDLTIDARISICFNICFIF